MDKYNIKTVNTTPKLRTKSLATERDDIIKSKKIDYKEMY